MLRKLRVVLTLVGLFFLSSAAMAEDASQRDEVIEQVMALSGISQQFEQLPKIIQMQMTQQPPPMAPKQAKAFMEIVLAAWEPSQSIKTIKAYLSEHYDAKHFAELVALLKRPIVRKMTAMENAAQTVDVQQQMMQQANVFMSQVSPQRVAIIREIDKETMASEAMVAVQLNMFQTMTKAVNPLLPSGQQMPPEQFEAISRNIREQALYPAQQQMVLQMAWAYQEATDQELTQYLKSYRSKVGQWSTSFLLQAALAVFDHVTEVIGNNVKQKILSEHSA